MLSRSEHRLNANWRFHPGFIAASTPQLANDATWRQVDLPHDWSMEGPFDPANILEAMPLGKFLVARDDSGLPAGEGWYRKTFHLDRDVFGNLSAVRAFLRVEGAFKRSRVWLNGEFVGENPSGYVPRTYDITGFLGANERPFKWPGSTCSITIHVDATEKQGHWHEGAGLYRDVSLILTPPCHLGLNPPQASLVEAGVLVAAELINSDAVAREGVLRHQVSTPDGKTVLRWERTVILPPGGTIETRDFLDFPAPHLWDVDDPFLYRLRSELEITALDSVDAIETPFGLRRCEFGADGAFRLNGRRLQIRGGCVHNDFAVFGAAVPPEANAMTVAELKAMGCNLLRSAHHHASESLMLECDQQGMLLWAEHRGLVALSEEVQFGSLRDSIRASRHHPCVVVWCLANHGGDAAGELTARLVKANAIAHAEDPTRPTAIALEGTSDHNRNGFALVTDLVGYNGGVNVGSDSWVEHGHERFPARKIIISEFGSGRGARGVYEDAPSVPGGGSYLAEDGRVFELSGGCFSVFGLCRRLEREWRDIVERPYLPGGIVWAAVDYWGETAGWPTVISQMGAALDVCRFRKDSYYFFQREWTTKPMLHLFPAWDWPGREGTSVPVWVYSNCAEVELFLNGKSLGAKAPRPGTHLEWEVVYEPGELRAVAVGERLETISHTPGPADHLVLEGRHFVAVSLADAAGNRLGRSDALLRVRAEGGAQLLGLASGDPCGKETSGNNSCRLFNGLALAVFRLGDSPGEATFAVEGLPTITIGIEP